MIFFGTRSRTVNGHVISGGVECPTCGHNEFQTFGHQHYCPIYWIPTFPTGRSVGMECTHCRHTLVDDEIPESLASRAAASTFAGRSRVPMFAGLMLIGMLVLYGAHTAAGVEAETEAVLDQPAVGDYYVVDYTQVTGGDSTDVEMPYTIWRVSKVSGDSVHFRESQYVYEFWSAAASDVRDGTAATEMDKKGDGISVDLDELAEWREAGAFKRALRP